MKLTSAKVVHLITRTEERRAQFVGSTCPEELGVVARAVVVRTEPDDGLMQAGVAVQVPTQCDAILFPPRCRAAEANARLPSSQRLTNRPVCRPY